LGWGIIKSREHFRTFPFSSAKVKLSDWGSSASDPG
jgi:hypothetical protein